MGKVVAVTLCLVAVFMCFMFIFSALPDNPVQGTLKVLVALGCALVFTVAVFLKHVKH